MPGNAQLDFKALARISGNRKVETVALKKVQPLTGYIRGGVTALASKKDYPVCLDETATLFEQITVSGGMRGMLLLLSPSDYLRAVNGTWEQLYKISTKIFIRNHKAIATARKLP